MDRRTVLTTLTAGTTTALAGCQDVLRQTVNTCGPGETAIEDLENDSGNEVQIRGEVTDNDEQYPTFVVDDGTGFADVYPNGGPPEEGMCVDVRGTVSDCINCEDNQYYLAPAVWEQV